MKMFRSNEAIQTIVLLTTVFVGLFQASLQAQSKVTFHKSPDERIEVVKYDSQTKVPDDKYVDERLSEIKANFENIALAIQSRQQKAKEFYDQMLAAKKELTDQVATVNSIKQQRTAVNEAIKVAKSEVEQAQKQLRATKKEEEKQRMRTQLGEKQEQYKSLLNQRQTLKASIAQARTQLQAARSKFKTIRQQTKNELNHVDSMVDKFKSWAGSQRAHLDRIKTAAEYGRAVSSDKVTTIENVIASGINAQQSVVTPAATNNKLLRDQMSVDEKAEDDLEAAAAGTSVEATS
ncbi:MAG: hypothetical protein H6679_04765 [Epsilonproteobacteria bacterium]|nr:hypothetical protein [Campylobacterota bacterium]